jgi:signal transduction histidine kinase
VRIALRRDATHLAVVIEDDGRGLPPGAAESAQTSGLAGIRERARLLGGVATIGNRPEGGARIEARLPLERIDSTPGALAPS